ncbi:hypothetical protein PR048_016373 [Dryococelus australis]|uniref:Uncharacterized protein n=1 Tax=Dryococelus australis TaxID=614101 RepID=A0ABQ9HJJ9_9NEOP|nr:hypothetical protein PR048_016373 [Dryococelus australis]
MRVGHRTSVSVACRRRTSRQLPPEDGQQDDAPSPPTRDLCTAAFGYIHDDERACDDTVTSVHVSETLSSKSFVRERACTGVNRHAALQRTRAVVQRTSWKPHHNALEEMKRKCEKKCLNVTTNMSHERFRNGSSLTQGVTIMYQVPLKYNEDIIKATKDNTTSTSADVQTCRLRHLALRSREHAGGQSPAVTSPTCNEGQHNINERRRADMPSTPLGTAISRTITCSDVTNVQRRTTQHQRAPTCRHAVYANWHCDLVSMQADNHLQSACRRPIARRPRTSGQLPPEDQQLEGVPLPPTRDLCTAAFGYLQECDISVVSKYDTKFGETELIGRSSFVRAKYSMKN